METDFCYSRRPRFACLLFLLIASSGCALTRTKSTWEPPGLLAPPNVFSPAAAGLEAAECSYQAGVAAESAGNPSCLDHYFAAAAQTWPHHAANSGVPVDRGVQLYRSSLQLLVAAAPRFGRFNPAQGILLCSGQCIPVSYHGFVWQPDDFCTLLPVGTYQSRHITTRYLNSGVGAPLVVLATNARQRPFVKPQQPFAATVVLKPNSSLPGGGFALEFYDSLRIAATNTGLPLARDLTSPIAYSASRESDAWLEDFLRPANDVAADGLHLREPFQPEKIPIVFIHGLASDPQTWSQLENDLRNQSPLFARYQLWMFRYDTGAPFLSSASMLRRQLAAVRQAYDPMRANPNLSRMVLVGHSMGGLVSKLQVTNSGDVLWQSAATRPLTAIYTDPATRSDLTNAFYFTPSPDVTRVIYIATPHRGSSTAQRCVGRISSALVEDPPLWRARHEQLVRDNPGAFRSELNRGIPTSVDLLEPGSDILQATAQLCYRPDVRLHSVIGNGRWSLSDGPSDGVVAVSSARLLGVRSEVFVPTEHTEINRRPETSCEVMRILSEHLIDGAASY